MNFKKQLAWALDRLTQDRDPNVDALNIKATLAAALGPVNTRGDLHSACLSVDIVGGVMVRPPDAAHLPLIAFVDHIGWGVVIAQQAGGTWLLRTMEGDHCLDSRVLAAACVRLPAAPARPSSFSNVMTLAFRQYGDTLANTFLACIAIHLLILVGSLVLMQVYDHLIPTHDGYLPILLISGVVIVILIELVMKIARNHTTQAASIVLDRRLSRGIIQRLFSVQIDQLPDSRGMLSEQLCGYEQVRSFHTEKALFAWVDLPVGLMYIVVVVCIGSPWIAVVIIFMLIAAFALGLHLRQQLHTSIRKGAVELNLKTALLAQTRAAADTRQSERREQKSAPWRLDRIENTWSDNLQLHRNNLAGHFVTTNQQMGYAAIFTLGSISVMQGTMTMGASIACAILGGRVIASITAIPGLLVQHAQSQAAIDNLENLFAMKTDPKQMAGY